MFPSAGPLRRSAPLALAAVFCVSGVLHLIRPGSYEALIPAWMPEPGAIIAVSGVAELVCAAGLVTRRRWAGLASALLLLAVWPGNISFALDAAREPSARQPLIALAWLRLPLQIPLIWAALQARRPAG